MVLVVFFKLQDKTKLLQTRITTPSKALYKKLQKNN